MKHAVCAVLVPKPDRRRPAGWSIPLLLAASTLVATGAAAQVDVTATAGTPAASYFELREAFAAINAGTHGGVITIGISGDTAESVSAVLNASGSGAALYTSIAISPTGGAARTILGAPAPGTPLIDLNGADNVTIDGLNTGGNSLTISNITVSATSGTSTIRFQADATNNVITNTSILGASTMAATTNGGNIWFGAGAVATGNDNNTISNCNIGPAGASFLPTKAVYGNGSTTSATLYNSGIVITNNNIFDFFNPAAQSNGVYLAGGNSDWTVSNNRFYQTATRTQTTGAVHSAIQVANANNNNHLISGNVIGYSSAAGTGTYTFVGAGTSSKFLPIYFSSAGTTTPSSVQGNTITAISLSGVVGGTGTSAAFVGISIASGIANVGNVAGNTIGSLTTPGSISVASANASAMEVYGIYYFPSQPANISNNVVAGITATNSGAGSLVVYGLRAFTGSAVTNTMQNNTVGTAAAPITNSSASTSSRVIGLYSQSGTSLVSGNTIGHLSLDAPNVGTGSAASVIGLWSDNTSATAGNDVARNTVRSLANTNAAAAVWVTGLHYNGSTTGTHVVQRNFVHALSTPSTSATATVNGINVQAGAASYQNNMVVLGNALTANSPQINGINETAAGTDNFYHNSVYIGGSAVADGTASSFAFQSSITTNTRDYRDNIFVNARSNGAATGKHYAVRVGGTAPNPAGLTSNNNVLYAPGAGGFTGLFNGVDQATLGDWQAATGQDGSSFSAAPQYLAPTATPPDLHINPAVTTVVEGNGVAIPSVTDDFDGQARGGLTPTDIGADAGNFTGLDLVPPAITYTPFGDTSLTTNRTLAATLTDVTGVATGVLAPRIYYRKNAGAYFSQACALTGGTTTSGTWDCVVNHADLGGVAVADVVSYFVIAQDTAVPANIGSNPPGAVATDVNTVSSPPPSPGTYTILQGFSGSLDVGSGQGYTSLTNAGGIFEALNAGVLTGDLVVNITSDLAGELGTHALNQWTEDGAGGYTLLIKPSGAARTITGDNPGALIRLNGADRVRIDGSTAATLDDAPAGPPARELAVQNINTGTAAVVIAVQSGSNGAQNNTLANLDVLGQSSTTTLVGISLGGAPGSPGTDNDGNRVENCSVRRAIYGIYAAGQNATNPDTGTVITLNDLTATGADRVRRVGIVVFNQDGVQITQNSVGGLDTNEAADAIGIGVGTQNVTTTTTTAGGVTNALVERNRVSGVTSTSTTGYSAAGIAVAAATGGTNTLVNNMVSGVISPATSPDLVAGLFVAGVSGATTRLFHNSVSMTGDRGTLASQTPSFALAVTGTNPTLVSRDNVLSTTQTSGGGTNAKSYAIGMVTSTFTNLDSDWNNFFSGGPNAGGFRSGSLTGGAGTSYATLLDWQTAVSDDANSLHADPLFVSATDLHLQPASPAIAAGTPVAGVTEDIDGDPRSLTAPDIGADEVTPRPADLAVTKTDGVTTAPPGGSVTYTIVAGNAGPAGVSGASVTDTFPAALTCTWTCAGTGGGTCSASGNGNINDSADLPAGASVTYTAVCGIALSATGTLDNTATVGGSPSDPNSANNSATDSDTLVPSADLAVTKSDGLATATPGTPVTYTITVNNFGPSHVPSATVTDTFPAELLNCTWTCTPSGGASCSASGSGDINDAVSLPAGSSVAYSATCDIDPAAIGNLANTADVSSAVSDPDTGNNSSTDNNTLTPSADLSVAQADGPDPLGVHRNVTYDVTVSNAGPSDAAGLTLTDTLPAGTTFVSSTPGDPTCTHSAGVVTCDLGALAAGADSTVSIVTTTSAPGSLTNTADAGSTTSDPDTNNNSAGEDTTVKFLKGDLDNDLDTDLFLAHTLTGEHRVWKMDGTVQTADQALNPSTPTNSTQQSVGVADFNGDFRNDIVFWDSATGAVEFWLMDDVDRQGGPVPLGNAPTLSTNWKLSATADFNHDGQIDIVWRNFTSQKIVIWTMNGTDKLGNLIPSPDQAVDFNWEIVGALDFDDDGNTDFLWYNFSSGRLVQWLMDANVVRTQGRFTTPNAAGDNNWKVLATSDYGIGPNGIPDSNDVVWRNATSGRFVVWHLDFTGVRTSGTFTTPNQPAGTPTDWTIVGPR